jgi:hypothetical protein
MTVGSRPRHIFDRVLEEFGISGKLEKGDNEADFLIRCMKAKKSTYL